MHPVDEVEIDEVDLSVAAWLEDGRWSVAALPPRAAESMDAFAAALRQLAGEGGALGFLSVDEDFFIAVRVDAAGTVRLMLSDLSAALDSPLAADAADLLDIELDEDEDDYDEVEPVGDFGLAADFGLSADDLEALCTDGDMYPDEVIASMAARMGFGEQFAAVLRAQGRDDL